MKSYNHKNTEKKWKKFWEENNTFKTNINSNKDKFYCLDMFPYPSGDGLHVGHLRGYVLSDIIARFKRLNGFEVLHPMGFDAFGLPAENAAIKSNTPPQQYINKAIQNFKRQLSEIGATYDYSKTVNTSEPSYYKWTQWLFIQLFNNGLAYQKEAKVNWCPQDQTVLANEQVIDGTCDRCGSEVEKKDLKQWYFKITDYAEELLKDLDSLDWPETVKTLQRNWIGKSLGAEISFPIKDSTDSIKVYTTRLDTVFGCTYLALSPENKLLNQLLSKEKQNELKEYIKSIKFKSDIEKQKIDYQKTGIDSGIKALNPFTNTEIPIWITDYVLSEYGSGAIMCVPAHDERDNEFARLFNLSIKQVVKPISDIVDNNQDKCFTDYGILFDSNQYSGKKSKDAIKELFKDFKSIVKPQTNYKMRDWLISRQRYWGAPIPIIHCPKCGTYPIDESELPVLLPEITDFKPKGKSPLATSNDFVNIKCIKCNQPAKRETDTLDTFVDSAWYFLRYIDNKNNENIFNSKIVNHWMPVDQYIGGVEHATKHLLYARFITKFLADHKIINFREPFKKLFGIGLIYYKGAKMSKSKGNVINPDAIVEYFGSDALRGYEMFIGPNDQFAEWSTDGMNGIYRFLIKIYKKLTRNLAVESNTEIDQIIDSCLYQYTQFLEQFKTNVAISQIMKLFNDIEKSPITKIQAEKIIIALSPIFPFISEELWEYIGNKPSILDQKWPEVIKQNLQSKKIPVQINGKVKFVFETSNFEDIDLLKKEGLAEAIQRGFIKSKDIKKAIIIPSKIINFLV